MSEQGAGTAQQAGGVTLGKINQWFGGYRAPNGPQAQKLSLVQQAGLDLATTILNNVPPGPDQTAAIRLIREACMTANAAILFDV
jgi:hypothetical protein